MLFDGGWPYLTRGRAVVLILALLGLGWLLLQTSRPSQPRMSLWRGPEGTVGAAQVSSAAPANALSAAFAPRGASGDLRPWGNPLGVPNTVMTQGYGVGTHAPANAWGAIDLAIDSTGDGKADPEGSWDHPVYATHAGTVKVTPNSWPGGNHVWVANAEYRTGYAHLNGFAVETGQLVERGQLIGYVGSSGMSSGPHLDYQVWQMQNGAWINLNPLDFGALEGTTRR